MSNASDNLKTLNSIVQHTLNIVIYNLSVKEGSMTTRKMWPSKCHESYN